MAFGLGVPAKAGDDLNNSADAIKTATPIKHEGIINADGTPGPNFAKAHQLKITKAPNGDNLANPVQSAHSYVPHNMPAIGDLFDMFDFDFHKQATHK